jgi:anthranilate phosphoribosyltransferase
VNAAAALAAYEGLEGDVTAALAAGLERAAKAVDSGAAAAALDRWVAVAQQ